MEGACLGKEDASGSGVRPLQWSQLSVPAVPVIALTTDITLTRSLEEHMLKKEHDNYVFSLVKAVTRAHCNVRRRGTTWRNTIRITGKFIRKTMTKLKLFNYQSHPVLHA